MFLSYNSTDLRLIVDLPGEFIHVSITAILFTVLYSHVLYEAVFFMYILVKPLTLLIKPYVAFKNTFCFYYPFQNTLLLAHVYKNKIK